MQTKMDLQPISEYYIISYLPTNNKQTQLGLCI